MAGGNAIPSRSRQIVRERESGLCARCGTGGNQWHHRRRRAVKRGHFQHCPCIGVLLCSTCHSWVHANPAKATESGFIISAHEDEPWTIPLKEYGAHWVLNDCNGGQSYPTLTKEK